VKDIGKSWSGFHGGQLAAILEQTPKKRELAVQLRALLERAEKEYTQ
jgi:hypothetical protein